MNNRLKKLFIGENSVLKHEDTLKFERFTQINDDTYIKQSYEVYIKWFLDHTGRSITKVFYGFSLKEVKDDLERITLNHLEGLSDIGIYPMKHICCEVGRIEVITTYKKVADDHFVQRPHVLGNSEEKFVQRFEVATKFELIQKGRDE